MATPQQLAAQAAAASVPTIHSINQQYNTSQNDTAGFTKALIGLLQGQSPGDAYQSATASQEAINNAVANRLSAAGSPYAAGSAAATAGMGGSALGNLVSQGAAANAYGAKMPAVAAGRGQMAQQSLITAQHQALQQRAQTYAQNFNTALQDDRSFGLQKQQLASSNRQFQENLAMQQNEFAQNLALNQEKISESAREFNQSQSQQSRQFQENLAASNASGSAGGSVASQYGLTANEWMTKQGALAGVATKATQTGMGIKQFIQQALTRGYPPPMAQYIAMQVYGNLAPPKGAGQQFQQAHPHQWQAWRTYVRWIQSRPVPGPKGPRNQRNPNPSGRG